MRNPISLSLYAYSYSITYVLQHPLQCHPPKSTVSLLLSVTVLLGVSWRAVSGGGITYTVCYSTTSGTQSDPPSGASGIPGTSTTLGPFTIGATYYIWVAVVSSDGRGPYSGREQETTYQGEQLLVISGGWSMITSVQL